MGFSDDFSTAGNLFQRLPTVSKSNRFSVEQGEGGALHMRFQFFNSRYPSAGVSITGTVDVVPQLEGELDVSVEGNNYPAVESYQYENYGAGPGGPYLTRVDSGAGNIHELIDAWPGQRSA
jgi:hypothetical protein